MEHTKKARQRRPALLPFVFKVKDVGVTTLLESGFICSNMANFTSSNESMLKLSLSIHFSVKIPLVAVHPRKQIRKQYDHVKALSLKMLDISKKIGTHGQG